jgi:hypothetical protein
MKISRRSLQNWKWGTAYPDAGYYVTSLRSQVQTRIKIRCTRWSLGGGFKARRAARYSLTMIQRPTCHLKAILVNPFLKQRM